MNVSDNYYLAVYGLFFGLSVLFSFLINILFLKFVKTLGMRDKDDTIIRWGTQSKPAVGGFSFYIIFLLSIIIYSVFFDSNQVFKQAIYRNTTRFNAGIFDRSCR